MPLLGISDGTTNKTLRLARNAFIENNVDLMCVYDCTYDKVRFLFSGRRIRRGLHVIIPPSIVVYFIVRVCNKTNASTARSVLFG